MRPVILPDYFLLILDPAPQRYTLLCLIIISVIEFFTCPVCRCRYRCMSCSALNITETTFQELKKHLDNPSKNYAWHHIVEQSQIGKRANFAPELIHNTNNIVRIPSGHNSIHSKISAFYSSKYNFTNGLTVRDWLASKDYTFQFDFGKKKLEEYGKLIYTDNGWIFQSH